MSAISLTGSKGLGWPTQHEGIALSRTHEHIVLAVGAMLHRHDATIRLRL